MALMNQISEERIPARSNSMICRARSTGPTVTSRARTRRKVTSSRQSLTWVGERRSYGGRGRAQHFCDGHAGAPQMIHEVERVEVMLVVHPPTITVTQNVGYQSLRFVPANCVNAAPPVCVASSPFTKAVGHVLSSSSSSVGVAYDVMHIEHARAGS
jgi:hypothetical protein